MPFEVSSSDGGYPIDTMKDCSPRSLSSLAALFAMRPDKSCPLHVPVPGDGIGRFGYEVVAIGAIHPTSGRSAAASPAE